MEIRLASYLQPDSIVDGEGIRTVVWTQGCSHNCPGCHNPGTHDFNGGFVVNTDDVVDDLKSLKGQSGITFSGGDPMFQAEACTLIAKAAKKMGLNVWCYTGFVFEDLIVSDKMVEFLKYIDVLVDGKFVMELKSLNVDFRGSTNQRVVDVKASLEQGKVIVVPKYASMRNERISIRKEKNIYI